MRGEGERHKAKGEGHKAKGEGHKGEGEEQEETPICPLPFTLRLHFEVEDTGIGIPSDKLDAIFQPFEQVRQAQVKKVGAGLGLAICQTLAQMMGAELHVKSVIGQGSTFWFDIALPVVQASVQNGARPKKLILPQPQTQSDEPADVPQPPMIPPPIEDLTQLYQLARVGDVISLQGRLHTLSESNPQYVPFERHIVNLARQLKLDEIEQFLQHWSAKV